MLVILSPTKHAGKRTKNRLREHPGAFTLVRTDRPLSMDGRESHFVRHPDGWFGWLAADEVTVTPATEQLEESGK
jgi:hypothetical protein